MITLIVNGNVYTLTKVQTSEFIVMQKEPYPDFTPVETWRNTNRYKCIIIENEFYVFANSTMTECKKIGKSILKKV